MERSDWAGRVVESAFNILAEWAWTKVNLDALQRLAMEAPSPEAIGQVDAAMKAYRHALRKKKALDAEEAHERSNQQNTMNNNLPPGVLSADIDGPQMPRCVRCQEEVNTVNNVGICEDCEAEEGRVSVHFSSQSNEWATPDDLFAKLDNEFHFTLDPCCTKENKKCPLYFTKWVDGLSRSWGRERVFMNPPYGRQIGKWMKKAFEESLKGALVVCLVPSRTDTRWFHDYAMKGTIRFLKGRIKFGGCQNSAPFPSCLVIFKPSPASLCVEEGRLSPLSIFLAVPALNSPAW